MPGVTTSTASGSMVRTLSTAELGAIVSERARDAHPLVALGGDTHERNGIRVLQTPDYDVWLLRWPPGTRVTPHDHGDSSGAFTVLRGQLIELRWRESIPECQLVTSGETVLVERGVVHDVVATKRVSYSLHAYSPPLETMSFYEVPTPTTHASGRPDSWRVVSLEAEVAFP